MTRRSRGQTFGAENFFGFRESCASECTEQQENTNSEPIFELGALFRPSELVSDAIFIIRRSRNSKTPSGTDIELKNSCEWASALKGQGSESCENHAAKPLRRSELLIGGFGRDVGEKIENFEFSRRAALAASVATIPQQAEGALHSYWRGSQCVGRTSSRKSRKSMKKP